MRKILGWCAGLSLACATGSRADVKTHVVRSDYQNGDQEIRVLLPDRYAPQNKYRVLYVLPVESAFNQKFGYGLGVLEQMKAHNAYGLIIVQMGFEKEPWYGDHATDPKTRQDSYLREFVIPFVERHYATLGTPDGRLLFGFSKSGWGAISLVMKYPQFFGYAASWDAPLLLTEFHFGMRDVYGTADQLARYRPDLLVQRQAGFFRDTTRLALGGEALWGTLKPAPGGGSHTVGFHRLLETHRVRHAYDGSLSAPHRWDRAWMEPMLKHLMSIVQESSGRNDPGGPVLPADAGAPRR